MSTRNKLLIFIIALLVLDQVVKIWIKTHMMLGEEFNVFGNWFKILFIENNGMAFGMELGEGKIGKTLLSLFRIIAVGAIGWYILKLIRDKAPTGVLFSFALIFCGALGNIIDSMFYGMIFEHSLYFNPQNYEVATLFPEGGGYSSFLHGKVVDMLYFPIYEGYLPDWLPIWGGKDFIFFRPVFNLADSYITIGVIMLILFYRRFFSDKTSKHSDTEITEVTK